MRRGRKKSDVETGSRDFLVHVERDETRQRPHHLHCTLHEAHVILTRVIGGSKQGLTGKTS